MAVKRGREVYRGRRKRLNVMGVVFGAIAVLLLIMIVLFYGLQRYIVFEHDGISVVLPGAQSDASSGDGTATDGELTQVNAALTVEDPDYSSLAATAGEGLSDMIGVFVPAADVTLSGVGRYMSVMSSYGANALVLEVKPVSGQLVWASSSETAAGYGTNGTTDLAQLVAALRQQDSDIYLVAQVCCCIDGLLPTRNPATALTLSTGAAYTDSEGAWLDPYNSTVSQYIIELCEELIGMGFDEIARQIYSHHQVESVYLMSGGFDLTVIIKDRSMRAVARFVSEQLAPMENVLSTGTHFILKKYKDNGVCFETVHQDDRLKVTP